MAIKPKEIKASSVPTPVEDKKNEVMDAALRQKQRHPGPWVKLTPDQVVQHTESGNLIGYDPKTGEGILKEDK